ncbi:hypothetical protein BKA62DRAFT_684242 [Auriculariales sp. MPI-PUGE-AT-0066]|nr:hypothetical protein BKA62DRAFT_684242 [Auriculariales sp. MPI-PUGE-AT-0066]
MTSTDSRPAGSLVLLFRNALTRPPLPLLVVFPHPSAYSHPPKSLGMANSQPLKFRPNMGRPESAIPPMDLSLLYRDSPEDKNVSLLAYIDVADPNLRRWAIIWPVGWTSSGSEVLRMLHLMQEPNHVGWTNWGPITHPLSDEDARLSRRYTVAHLSSDARQRLERIAGHARVQEPDGTYGTQHWVVDLLREAVEHGILTNSQCRAATHAAWEQ